MTKMRTCKWCGNEFTPSQDKSGNPQKYCSQRCRLKGYARAKIEANIRYRRKYQGKPTKCRWCGTIFLSIHGRYYCSNTCKKEARREQKLRYQQKYRIRGVSDKQRYFENLGNSNLRQHRKNNFNDERNVVKSEKRRLGI